MSIERNGLWARARAVGLAPTGFPEKYSISPLPPLDSLNLAASSPVNDPPPFAWTRSILLAGGRSHSLSRPRSFLLAQRNGRQWKREPTLAPAISPSCSRNGSLKGDANIPSASPASSRSASPSCSRRPFLVDRCSWRRSCCCAAAVVAWRAHSSGVRDRAWERRRDVDIILAPAKHLNRDVER